MSRMSSKVVEESRRDNDAWCIVATDGSTRIIACKTTSNAPGSSRYNRVTDEDRARPSEISNEALPDAHEPGVDLSYLDVDKEVEKETVSKLIAGMQAMTMDEPASSLRREIAMPSAKTDLQEIFKTDNVCMISPLKTATEGFGVQSSGVSQAASSST